MMARLAKWDVLLSRKMRLRPEQTLLWRLNSFLAHSGDSWFWLAGLGLVWLFTRGEWRQRSALMGIAVVGLAVLVLAIKFIVRRQRPEGEWGAIYRNTDPHSFPSGHAARAILLGVLAWSLGPVWFGWMVILWSPLVSMARISMGVHYLSDVLAGMVLGMLAGVVFIKISPFIMQLVPFIF